MIKREQSLFFESVSEVPMQKPTNLRVPSQADRIRQYVRLEQMLAQQSRDVETFDEADDFDLDDDEQWVSPYEDIFEPADDPLPDPGSAQSAGVGQSPTQTASPAPGEPASQQQQ